MKKKSTVFFLATFISFNCLAQSNFIPGYIITNNNDTIEGFVDYRGLIKNSKQCSFKQNLKEKATIYLPGDISKYRFNDNKFYVSKQVTLNNEEKPVFLEYIVDGIIDLYFLRERTGDHYFLETQEGRMVELTNEQKLVNTEERGSVYLPTKKFQGILKSVFSGWPEGIQEAEKAELNQENLISITQGYHAFACDDEECITYAKTLPRVIVRKGIIIGDEYTNAGFDQDEKVFERINFSVIEFSYSGLPYIGFGMSFSIPDINENLSLYLQADLGYRDITAKYTNQTVTRTENFDIRLSMIPVRGSLNLNYNFPGVKVRPFAGIGLNLQYNFITDAIMDVESITSDNDIINETVGFPFAKTIIGANAAIGASVDISNNRVLYFGLKGRYGKGDTYTTQIIKTVINGVSLDVGLFF